MQLETERLRLRPWREEDAEALYKYASDPDVGPITGWPAHKSVEESLEVIRNVLSVPQTYAIVLKETGEVIGDIGIMTGSDSNLELDKDEAELGFWLGKPYWGRGLMPEAVRETERHCFEALGMKKLWCGYFDGNLKSKRTQEKCDFVYSRTDENYFCKPMNEYRTLHIFSLSYQRWNALNSIRKDLFEMQDESYREFSSKLTPNIRKETVIGVRTPALRAYAKKLAGTENAKLLLESLPHRYYEENNLHGFLIETEKDYDKCIRELDRFLPYVDNWSTCDLMSPRAFEKNKDRLIENIKLWISGGGTYSVRFGIEMLMKHFLGVEFRPEYLSLVSAVRSDEYYINMMIAWFFATALAKQYEAALPFLLEKRLSPWVHNKTIQKAVESNRIPKETKEYLKTLKIKETKNER